MFDPNKSADLLNSERLPVLTRENVSREDFEEAARDLANYSLADERRDFDEQDPEGLESGEVASEAYLNIRKILAYLDGTAN